MRLVASVCLALFGSIASASAISPIHIRRIDPPAGALRFGRSVSCADVDHDGIPDFAVGANRSFVCSGADGHVLREFQLDGDEVDFVGDTDEDGTSDLVVASWRLYRAALISGATGVVRSGSLGYLIGSDEGESIAGLGDVDGDHVADFVIGYQSSTHEFSQVYSGKEVNSTGYAIERGHSVAGLGDVNGDGRGDFVAGRDFGIQIFSGANGRPLASLPGYDPALAGCDVDGDGIKDALLSMPAFIGGHAVALVVSYSGATGALIDTVTAIDPLEQTYFRGFVVGLGDIDGDAHEDFAVSYAEATVNGRAEAGLVQVFSGATGDRLATVRGEVAGGHFGWSLAAPGDIDGDGTPDLVVGQPDGPVGAAGGSGAVFVYRLKRGPLTPRLDLLPGSCPNRIAVHGNGAVELAFLTGGEFAPSEIDPSSVRLGGVLAERERNHAGDLASADGATCDCAYRTGDGEDDRVFQFSVPEIRSRLSLGQPSELIVTASLRDGRAVEGSVCATLDRHRNGMHDEEGVAGAWPNPASRGGEVSLRFPGRAAAGQMSVYDPKGRLIAKLATTTNAGWMEAVWNTKDERGALVPSGLYLIRVKGAPAARVLIIDP